MDDQVVARAAEILCRARLDGGIVEALPEYGRPRNEEEAYAIQAALHDQLTAAGQGPLDGYKIGCTTPVMQAFLKISQPCAGGVLAPTVRIGTGRFRTPARGRLGVECEVAVRLRAALDPSDSPYQRDHIADAVGSCMAAIEIVADRYDDYGSLGTPTLIADDFFNAGIVLGDPVEDWRDLDLAALRGQMAVNGEVVGSGVGGDILGPSPRSAGLACQPLERPWAGPSCWRFCHPWQRRGNEVGKRRRRRRGRNRRPRRGPGGL